MALPIEVLSVLSSHTIVFDPANEANRAGEGLLIAVRKCLSVHTQRWLSDQSSLWVRVKFTDRVKPVFFANCYIPPSSSLKLRDCDLEARLLQLQSSLQLAAAEGQVFMAGDFNARIGVFPSDFQSRPYLRGCSDHVVTSHGRNLCNFAHSNACVILTGQVKGDLLGTPTFQSRSNSVPSRLDHIITPIGDVSLVQSVSVDESRDESDHFPLLARLSIHAMPLLLPEATGTKLKKVTWRFSSQDSYATALQGMPTALSPTLVDSPLSLDQEFKAFTQSILNGAAMSGMPCRESTTRPRDNAPFYDTDCVSSKRRLRAAIRHGATGEILREMVRKHKSLVRTKRRAYRINELYSLLQIEFKDPRRFWKRLTLSSPELPLSLQSTSLWGTYMANLCNVTRLLSPRLPETAFIQRSQLHAVPLNRPFTHSELIEGIKHLRNGRAPGPQGIVSELLRYGRHVPTPEDPDPSYLLAPKLLSLINSAFSLGHVPSDLNVSLISPIYKRGDSSDTKNYRPIAVSDPILRLYANMLNARLVSFTEECGYRSPVQAAFRPNLSTLHCLFSLQHAIEASKHQGKRLFCCFLDLKSAYDFVDRPLLWTVLCRLGIHGRMLGAVQSLYANATYAIKIKDRIGAPCPSLTGLKQGCPLSPTLFGLFIDGLSHHLASTCPAAGFEVSPGTKLSHLMYADDITLIAGSACELQDLIDAATLFCETVGLQISAAKTAIMCFPGSRASISFTCCGLAIQPCQEVKYLGLQFNSSVGVLSSVHRRQQSMWTSWTGLKRRVAGLHCSTSVGLLLRLYNICVPPAADYGCEIWGHRKMGSALGKVRRAIQQGHVTILRAISGLRHSTPHPIVFSETQTHPSRQQWLSRSVRFWNNLIALSSASMFHQIWCASVSMANLHARGWAQDLLSELRDLNFCHAPALNFTVPVRMDISQIPCLFSAQIERAFLPSMVACENPRNFPSDGIILCTYLQWFRRPRPPTVVLSACDPIHLRLPAKLVRLFLRFRSGCSGLPVDVGRAARIPRNQRHCLLCTSESLCDERHLIFECSALSDLRVKYRQLFTLATATMSDFMWQKDTLLVAKFVSDALAMALSAS